jgi:hypothetical protein
MNANDVNAMAVIQTPECPLSAGKNLTDRAEKRDA